jgi:hypothetical protein
MPAQAHHDHNLWVRKGLRLAPAPAGPADTHHLPFEGVLLLDRAASRCGPDPFRVSYAGTAAKQPRSAEPARERWAGGLIMVIRYRPAPLADSRGPARRGPCRPHCRTCQDALHRNPTLQPPPPPPRTSSAGAVRVCANGRQGDPFRTSLSNKPWADAAPTTDSFYSDTMLGAVAS